MKSVLRHLVGPLRNAMQMALEEVSEAAGNPVQLERGWKFFLLLPRMLLHRPPRGGLILKPKLSESFHKFARGEWMQLIRASIQCDEQAAVGRRRKGRRANDLEQAIRALNFLLVGEFISRGRGQPISFRQNVLRCPFVVFLGGFIWRHPHDPPRRRRRARGPLMPFSSLWHNTERRRLCKKICTIASSSSRIWMKRTLPPLHTDSEMWMRICGLILASASMVARRRCGMQSTEVIARRSDPEARVWRGSDPQFVEAHLTKKSVEHEVLLERIPTVPDLQSAWSFHCASARANCLWRVVSPAATRGFAHRHNEGLWKCLCEILHVEADRNVESKLAASMPLNFWWNGVEDAVRVAVPAYWASLADCIPMIFNRHPDVANLFVHELEGAREGALGVAVEARRAVIGVLGFDPPTWEDLAHRARPPPAEHEDMEPCSGHGWQHVAASKVEFQQGGVVHSHGAEPQSAGEVTGWSRAGMALSVVPTHHLTRIPPHLFRIVLLRRLRSHCLFHCTLAGVVKLTSLATTEHRVHEQACWGDEGSHWKV